MSLFISTYKNKVDKKCRVSVPSQFRSVFAKSSYNGIILYKSIINQCLEACTMERLESVYSKIDSLDHFSEERDAFATSILGGSYQLGFDPEGRVVIPSSLLGDVEISDNAVFVGKGHTFEIWSEEKFDKYIIQARELALKNKMKLVQKS
jgi:MraZ protein